MVDEVFAGPCVICHHSIKAHVGFDLTCQLDNDRGFQCSCVLFPETLDSTLYQIESRGLLKRHKAAWAAAKARKREERWRSSVCEL